MKHHKVAIAYFVHLASLTLQIAAGSLLFNGPIALFLLWMRPGTPADEIAFVSATPSLVMISLVYFMTYLGWLKDLDAPSDTQHPPEALAGPALVLVGGLLVLSTPIYLSLGIGWAASGSALVGFIALLVGLVTFESVERAKQPPRFPTRAQVITLISTGVRSRIVRPIVSPIVSLVRPYREAHAMH